MSITCSTFPCNGDSTNNATFNLPGCSISYTAADVVNCYCMGRLASFLDENPYASHFSLLSEPMLEDELCNDVKNNYLLSVLTSNFVGFILNIVNEVISRVIAMLVEWEHTHTISEIAATVCSRINIFNVINTAFLPVFLTWDIFSASKNSMLTLLQSSNTYIGFVPKWYHSVGFSIIHAMVFDSIITYLVLAIELIIKSVRKALKLQFVTAYTQKGLMIF